MSDNEELEYLDGRGALQVVSPVCTYCIHIIGHRRCKAFAKIPIEIWEGHNDHTQPYPGDGGVRFDSLIESLRQSKKNALETLRMKRAIRPQG